MFMNRLLGSAALCGAALALPAAAQAQSCGSNCFIVQSPASGSITFAKTLVGQQSTGSQIRVTSVASFYTTDTVSAPTGEFVGSLSTDYLKGLGSFLSNPYSFAPTVAGSATGTVTVSTGNGSQTATVTLHGTGVAPVESISFTSAAGTVSNAATLSFGEVRLGTTALATLTVSNTGNGDQASGIAAGVGNLNGSVTFGALGAGFSVPSGGTLSLGDGTAQSYEISYAPTVSGSQTAAVTASFTDGSSDKRNQANSEAMTLTATGAGPVFASTYSPGSVIDVGTVMAGTTIRVFLPIANVSADVGDVTITGLNVVPSFAAGSSPDFALDPQDQSSYLLDAGGELGVKGDYRDVIVDIVVPADAQAGTITGDLHLATDQDAPYDSYPEFIPPSGQSFDFTFQAEVLAAVPEPAGIALMLPALAALGAVRRRVDNKS